MPEPRIAPATDPAMAVVDDTTIPGTALVHTGPVTVCCGLHKPGDWGTCCANDDDCTPCCERCPTCPMGPDALPYLIRQDWTLSGLADLGPLIDAVIGGRP